jgi:hypothetical protein
MNTVNHNIMSDTTKDAGPSEDAIEQECPECGALCLFDDGNYVAIESLPVESEVSPQNAPDVRNALVSLECVRQWLNGGCDPKAASVEITGIMRMLQGDAPAQVQAEAVRVPDGWKLVPIKPTAEIVKAGGKARMDDFNRNGTTLSIKDANRVAEAMYRAMIEAAPSTGDQS